MTPGGPGTSGCSLEVLRERAYQSQVGILTKITDNYNTLLTEKNYLSFFICCIDVLNFTDCDRLKCCMALGMACPTSLLLLTFFIGSKVHPFFTCNETQRFQGGV